MTETNVLQLVSPPRQVPEVVAALRSWQPGGFGALMLASRAQLPLTAEECRLLAHASESRALARMGVVWVIRLG